MKIIDAKLKVQHDCPFCNISALFPNARIATWCNGRTDILQVTVDDPDDLDSVLGHIQSWMGFKEVVRERGSALTMSRKCGCQGPNVVDAAEHAKCWVIEPIIYLSGWETYRVVAPNKSALRNMVKEVRSWSKVDVASVREMDGLGTVRDIGIVPVHLFEDLTAKQVMALVAAYENGLLDIPAKTDMKRVAKSMGMSRSTYGEHLRKAVQKVVENSYPILKLYVNQ